MSTLTSIDIGLINAAIQIRKTSEPGVQRMVRSLQERGYLDRYPIAVAPAADGFKLLDGNHRVEAARRLEISRIPAQVYEDLTPNDEVSPMISCALRQSLHDQPPGAAQTFAKDHYRNDPH